MKHIKNNPLVNTLEEEPWVDIATEDDLSNWDKSDEIKYNQASRQREKLRFYVLAFDFLNENGVKGDCFEFGCHRARTFRMALTEARRHKMDYMNFLAFDSFEGLPDEGDAENKNWKQGELTTSEKDFIKIINDHGIYVDKVSTNKGFYHNSLNKTLENELINLNTKISIATIDYDLYESAVPVFKFIDPFLQRGSIIYLDDIFAGYKGDPYKSIGKAFLEYQKYSKWSFINHLNVGWWGRSYIVCKKGEKLNGIL